MWTAVPGSGVFQQLLISHTRKMPVWRCQTVQSPWEAGTFHITSLDLCSMPEHWTYLYSGIAFAWKSAYTRQVSGLFFITNLTGQEQQFQRLFQGSLRACLPDLQRGMWSMVWAARLPLMLAVRRLMACAQLCWCTCSTWQGVCWHPSALLDVM